MSGVTAGVESSVETLDHDLLQNLLELGESADEDIVGELVTLFFEQSAPAHLERLAVALAARDVSTIAGAAHSLYGASASLGAKQVATLCQQLEAQAGLFNLDTAANLLAQLDVELPRAQEAFSAALARAHPVSS